MFLRFWLQLFPQPNIESFLMKQLQQTTNKLITGIISLDIAQYNKKLQ